MRLLFFILVVSLSAITHAANYVNTTTSTLYSGPGSSHPVSHTGLAPGTKLAVLKSSKGFTLIKTPNGELGWIKSSALKSTAPIKPKPKVTPKPKPKAKPKNINKPAHSNRKTRNAIVSIGGTAAGVSTASASSATVANTNTAQSNEKQDVLKGIDSALNNDASKNTKQPKEIQHSTPAENRLSLLSKENLHLRKELQKAKEYINFNSPQESSSTGWIQENEQLRSQLELLQTENQRLQESNQSQSTFNKIITFLLGLVAGVIVSALLGGRKKKEDW